MMEFGGYFETWDYRNGNSINRKAIMFILGVVSSVKITLSIFAPIYLVKIKRNVKRLLILLRYNGIICKEKKKHKKGHCIKCNDFFLS